MVSARLTQPTTNNQQQTTRRGFTLIELLVVIGIIGVLASVLIITLNPLTQFEKTRDAQRKNDFSNIAKALELYYDDNNAYPPNTVNNEITGGIWGSRWGNYIQRVPADPTAGRRYAYIQTQSGQGYRLYTALERCQPGNCNDAQACNPADGAKCTNSPDTACGSGAVRCTFARPSTNEVP